MAVAKQDQQAGMFDHEWDDEELEGAISEWIALGEMRSQLAKIKRRIDEGKERNGIKDLAEGDRVRVGEFTFEARNRSGGGFEIPEWQTVGMAGLRAIAE